ncbi:MAG: hypothetical protein HN849_20005 [Victivallales bacterium]|nr:hypothetical protein [Victivallales bacterium]MBT7164260.1 hypothetical protein [Victivallales bacterium]MBT7301819.1 hypothetical protein [Victivallales bacterium]
MKQARQVVSRLGLGLLAAGIGVLGQPAARRGLMSLPVNRITVHDIRRPRKAVTGVDSIDWSAANNSLLIGRLSTMTRFFNVCTVTPEGINPRSRVLGMRGGSARVHSGAPSWHPDGKSFVFSCQKQHIEDHAHAVPLIGWHTDMWLADREGTSFTQLTNESSSRRAPKGVTNPRFSPDGTKLVWSGNNGKTNRSPWQQKALFLADFGQEEGKPKLSNIREFQPGENRDFYESYGFSPDGNSILFAANMIRGNPWHDTDICVSRSGQDPDNLTESRGVWDRFATYSPNGKKIIWTSSRGIRIRYLGTRGEKWQRYLQSELWIMDADGRHQKQLTFFNQPAHPHSEGRRVFLGDSAFSPDGESVAIVLYKEKQNFVPESEIVILKLGDGPPPRAEDGDPGNGGKPPAPKPPKPKGDEPKGDPGTITW